MLEPKVPLRNLFAMLEYAFDLRGFSVLTGVFECDSIADFFDRFASLLAKKVMARARTGLYKSYRDETEYLTHIRGRMDLVSMFKGAPAHTVLCEFEEQTMDIEENRIIAWTLHVLLMSGCLTEGTLEQIRKADKLLRGAVALQAFKGSQCVGRAYNRLNADYEPIHLICRFFLDCLGPTHEQGNHETVPFMVDMAGLFEVFVARWLKANLPDNLFLKAQDYRVLGSEGNLILNPDIVLYDRESRKAVCILDTKYKVGGSVSGSDYYQVVAYAEALDCLKSFLVYPKELSKPFNEKPGNIRVRSIVFDLDQVLDLAGKDFIRALFPEDLKDL